MKSAPVRSDYFNKKTVCTSIILLMLLLCTMLSLLGWTGCISHGAPEEKGSILKNILLSSFTNDSLKLKAGYFLLDHMPFHNYTGGDLIKAYQDSIERYQMESPSQLNVLKLLQKKQTVLIGVNSSDDAISSAYFLNHINLSINNYRKYRWDKEISFNDYCKYVLPYRIGKEYPSEWISYFHNKYLQDNDSSIFTSSLDERINKVLQWLKNRKEGFSIKQLDLPELSVITCDHLRVGTCHELTKVTSCALRAFGIPVAVDFTPFYSNRNGQHEWTVIMRQGKSHVVNIATAKIEMDVDTAQRHFSKVYRKTFEYKGEGVPTRNKYKSYLPEFLNDLHNSDVTDLYYKTHNITLPISVSDTSNVYLAVFNQGNWIPVGTGDVYENKVHFNKVPPSAVYLPMALQQNEIKPAYLPFVVRHDGKVEFIEADTSALQRVLLTRKYPLFDKIQFFIDRMVGGVFEGANDPEFKNATILWRIKASPGDNYNIVTIPVIQKFRYVRYVGPATSACNVAEIKFYKHINDSVSLNGNVIGTDGAWENSEARSKKAAFDGDPLSFFDYKDPDGGWTGLDLGEPMSIAKIKFIARTDMNIIEEGHQYDLFYWDNGWKSLGQKTASTSQLVYENVPSGALLWLRNLTAGTEERIFQYENGRQVWR